MSTPIQSTPAVPSGAQSPEEVLSADVEQRNRSGFSGRQNQMSDSIGRGSQVDIDQGANPRIDQGEVNGVGGRAHSATSDGLSVAGRAVSVKQTDHRALEGSNAPNDFRQRGKDAQLPPNPAIRQPMTQAKMCSSKLDSNASQVTFPGNLADSDAGN